MAGHVAVVVIHGIGEQVPMDTLTSFVKSVWEEDLDLPRKGKPNPDTGEKRTKNAAWYKPDPRTRNFDLRLITTESYETEAKERKRADFFEFYWAHRVTGTQLEVVRAWILGLMLRNPLTNVPRPLWLAWGAIWLVAIAYLVAIIVIPDLLDGRPLLSALAIGVSTVLGALFAKVLNNWVGDIVRYVDPSPRNIKTRQEIREDGVRLLETLLGVTEDGKFVGTHYDRVTVVCHSLGTIVGYDILNHTFGRLNTRFDRQKLSEGSQDELAKLEAEVRAAWAGEKQLDVSTYRTLQDSARRELNDAGNPWIVSDFITLGSPLTHAEFLMAKDRAYLAKLQETRIYPTCPPQLEYHRADPNYHFTYEAEKALGKGGAPLAGKRVPHHAATFAFTRWTNIYSPLRRIIGGDIVSGPLCNAFGLLDRASESVANTAEQARVCGIAEHPVLPSVEGTAQDKKKRILTHLAYWDSSVASTGAGGPVPHHIQVLRDALDLKERAASPVPAEEVDDKA